jgi:SET domain-containing protein
MDNNIFEIKKSNIHGNGLFAKIRFLKGEKLTRYYGRTITRDEFNKSGIDKYYYLGRKFAIVSNSEPYLTLNPVNYINEGPDPNVMLRKKALYTTRDIKKGEELTLKYPDSYKRTWEKNEF